MGPLSVDRLAVHCHSQVSLAVTAVIVDIILDIVALAVIVISSAISYARRTCHSLLATSDRTRPPRASILPLAERALHSVGTGISATEPIGSLLALFVANRAEKFSGPVARYKSIAIDPVRRMETKRAATLLAPTGAHARSLPL